MNQTSRGKQSKGQKLLYDFLNKLGKSLNNPNWDNLTATWEARSRLEAYLSPPRDERGHFIAPKQEVDKEVI